MEKLRKARKSLESAASDSSSLSPEQLLDREKKEYSWELQELSSLRDKQTILKTRFMRLGTAKVRIAERGRAFFSSTCCDR